ncbi:MAG: pyridoxine 5'-phosphate synthase [Phycisphaerae bacterium]|nr:pyridoxine 5'-phosphate synthase [Phycisphaerae bacterium]
MIKFAKIAIDSGAYGITVHPRPDQRHIRYSDVYELSDILTVEFNIEGNPFTGNYMQVVCDVKPAQATLVPDEPSAETSDHGWDLKNEKRPIADMIKRLKGIGTRVSLFIDPDEENIELAARLGADRVELYTEPYAKAFTLNEDLEQTIEKYAKAAKFAINAGLGLNAGHDLNLKNLKTFLTRVKGISEVSIGHALIADALEMGLENAVKEYCKLLDEC